MSTMRLRAAAGSALSSRTRAAPRPVRAAASRRPLAVRALFGGGQGGGVNPFNVQDMMEKVKKAQEMVAVETQKLQTELNNTEFEGYDEDETVRVVLSGNQEPRSVDVTQAAVDAGAEELSRRLTVALKEAHGKSVAGMKERMRDLARSLGLPNLPNAGGPPGA